MPGRGYPSKVTRPGSEAVKLVDKVQPDVVLLDIRMPGVDGNGVAKHIRNSKGQSVPVIAISGTPWQSEDKIFDMVLPKPFPLKKLVESIRSVAAMATPAAVGM